MSARPIGVQGLGLRVSVGLNSSSACAAIRAKVANPAPTRYTDSNGDWIIGHQVPSSQSWRGSMRLAYMAVNAIEDCLYSAGLASRDPIPLILCTAETQRPGRNIASDERLLSDVQDIWGGRFGNPSSVIASGRTSLAMALECARTLLYERHHRHVLVAAADSLLNAETLRSYDQRGRLLTAVNSNGFMPGEGAGAVLVGKPDAASKAVIRGIGFAAESATIESDKPLRADGLTTAIQAALRDANCALHDLDLRVADLSGEQYYFKEAAIAIGRLLRHRKAVFELWHPAECVGETGAAAGFVGLCVATTAITRRYAPGAGVLLHQSDDDSRRAALVLTEGAT